MNCYYQGCTAAGTTMEHVPPRCFFPKDQRQQLLTVTSCPAHNNAKSNDDTYVLAHICMNASPSNRSREVFQRVILPQLSFGEGALRKLLAKDAVHLGGGAVAYPVDRRRFDRFFDALACGIVHKSCGAQLPPGYKISHVYHGFHDEDDSPEEVELRRRLEEAYSGQPVECLDFGQVKTLNTAVYSAKLFGVRNFGSSITLTHEFFGHFRVSSMLSRRHLIFGETE